MISLLAGFQIAKMHIAQIGLTYNMPSRDKTMSHHRSQSQLTRLIKAPSFSIKPREGLHYYVCSMYCTYIVVRRLVFMLILELRLHSRFYDTNLPIGVFVVGLYFIKSFFWKPLTNDKVTSAS